ncbi:hypothetical protein FGO68_gene17705 [Halteria grandinella]|uniref:Vitellogenin domain-containing protein n=1 Tax=Halteria grandinella TaxID=5974 RepID=A0A8J8SX75_HALGN|nr:hypothetical protein FGO68_gene17705 [Halteria grandinella]
MQLQKLSYKLECELDYLMTFLTKRDYSVATETLNLVHRLCANQEVTSMLLKDHHFHYLVELSSTSPSEDVRSLCFKIFGSLALSPSKQVVKMLFHQTRLVRVIADRLSKETSEDVISSILLFLMKITSTDEVYLELLTTASDDDHYLKEVIACMNNRKSKKVRRLAYSLVVNLLCYDEMRRYLLKQSQVDIVSKLISVISGKHSSEDEQEDIILALKALSNMLSDTLFVIAFLQAKGHFALAQSFESKSLHTKELCLTLYTKLALPANQTDGSPLQPMMTVVLDAELIQDVLTLPLNEDSLGCVRNMLILLQVMVLSKNEKGIAQLKAFDICGALIPLIQSPLSYLALGTLGLLEKLHPSDRPQLTQGRNNIFQAFTQHLQLLIQSGNNDKTIQMLNRAFSVYLISIGGIEQQVLALDGVISLVREMTGVWGYCKEAQAKYSCIQVLKTLSEMGNKQISDVIHSIDSISQQVLDAPSLNRLHIDGIINDILDKEMHQHFTYFLTDDIERSGMDQSVDFHYFEKPQKPIHQDETIDKPSGASQSQKNEVNQVRNLFNLVLLAQIVTQGILIIKSYPGARNSENDRNQLKEKCYQRDADRSVR